MNFWLKKCAMEVIKYAICLCFIVSCKNSNNINTSKNHISIKTSGGKAHTFTEMPGFFVELVFADFNDDVAHYKSSENTLTIKQSPSVDLKQTSTIKQTGKETDYNNPTKTLTFCSGAHIGEGYILTAAHCLKGKLDRACSNYNPSNLGINFIRSDNGTLSKQFVSFNKMQAVYHKKFASVNNSDEIPIYFYDIALLRVPEIYRSNFAEIANIPNSDLYSPQKLNKAIWVYGAGKDRIIENKTLYYGGMAHIQGFDNTHVLTEEDNKKILSSLNDEEKKNMGSRSSGR